MPTQHGPGSTRTRGGVDGSAAGPPAFDDDPFEPIAAIKWAFELYRADIALVALPIVAIETLVLLAAFIIPKFIGSILRSVVPANALAVANMIQYSISLLLGVVAMAYFAASLYPYLLNLARGRPVELTEAFRPARNFPSVLKLVGLLAVATALGLFLCAAPGIAVIIVGTTAVPALIDRDLDLRTALSESVGHAKAHFLQLAIFGLLCIAMTLIGAAFCAVGAVLVSVPIVMLAQIYVYLCLEGESPVHAG